MIKAWTFIRLEKATRDAMKQLKVHPKETYEDIIKRIVLDQKLPDKTTIEARELKDTPDALHNSNEESVANCIIPDNNQQANEEKK